MNEPKSFWVNGIVSQRDKRPYLQLSNEDQMIAQLSMGQARSIAYDMLVQASRAEADAMLLKFFSKMDFPENAAAAAALMQEFRAFRAELDAELVERGHGNNLEELK